MMRLPHFAFRTPRRIEEAASILAAEGPDAMPIAGGTDLLPNMKRRHQLPRTLVSLRRIPELRGITNGLGTRIGAGVTLTEIVRDPGLRRRYRALWQAAAQVATPHLRNMGTIGGNLCLDTRCTYYDQSYEWRKAIGFCMKKDGDTCWVAPSSSRCLAVSSTDGAPALSALGATVWLVSSEGQRSVAIEDLYRNDGIDYIARRPDEIVSRIELPAADGWTSAYWKLRRRGSFDFPVLSVAAAARLAADGTVVDVRIVLGAVASCPMPSPEAAAALLGKPLTDGAIAEAAELAFRVAKPMDNTDFTLHWRKRVTREFVTYALRELRGDDVSDVRRRIARHELLAL
jgi:4-hydroxybenzoyl-CoA reductase subunit beta